MNIPSPRDDGSTVLQREFPTIATAADRAATGNVGHAWCPLCGLQQDAADHGFGERFAISIAVARVWTHLKSAHGIPSPSDLPALIAARDREVEADTSAAEAEAPTLMRHGTVRSVLPHS